MNTDKIIKAHKRRSDLAEQAIRNATTLILEAIRLQSQAEREVATKMFAIMVDLSVDVDDRQAALDTFVECVADPFSWVEKLDLRGGE